MLGCTPQAGKPCSCLALRPNKQPGDSDRDISGLLDRGSYENRLGAANGEKNTAGFTACRGEGSGGRRRPPFIGKLTRGEFSYQGLIKPYN